VTSDETFAVSKVFVEKIGKTPIEVRRRLVSPSIGILCPMINEAIFAYAEGVASAEDT